MKNISVIFISFLFLIMPVGLSFGQESKRVFKETFSPRHTDSVCPPDYRTTREDLEFYLYTPQRKIHGPRRVGGVDLEELAEDFDIALPVMADFEVLSDSEDLYACKRLNEKYDDLIGRQVQLFEGGEPEYLYDISYYKGAGFYVVVVAGGVLIQGDPLKSNLEAYYAAPFGAYVVLYDEEWNRIHDRFNREMTARREINPTDDKSRD